jgi:hypothetical protein
MKANQYHTHGIGLPPTLLSFWSEAVEEKEILSPLACFHQKEMNNWGVLRKKHPTYQLILDLLLIL